jgi:CubicO group peptidase (beta-lactamase class C family)
MGGWELSRHVQWVAGPARAARRQGHRRGCGGEPWHRGAHDRGRRGDVGRWCAPARRRDHAPAVDDKAVTTVAALGLVAAGRLGLDEPVERWLPELADRQVLRRPSADLADPSAAVRAITLRQLLTNTCGYGMVLTACPLQRAMADSEIDAGVDPVRVGAEEWLARLAALALAFQPGEGWRYHHAFAILGILIARVAGRPLQDQLTDDLLGPLGLGDSGLWVSAGSVARLPASYWHTDAGLVELEPAAGGFYAGDPPFEVSHAELVSTVGDDTRFARMLADGGRFEGQQIVSQEHLRLLTSDQVPTIAKPPDSFFPGFGTYRLGLRRRGRHQGRAGRPLWVVRGTGHQLLRRP